MVNIWNSAGGFSQYGGNRYQGGFNNRANQYGNNSQQQYQTRQAQSFDSFGGFDMNSFFQQFFNMFNNMGGYQQQQPPVQQTPYDVQPPVVQKPTPEPYKPPVPPVNVDPYNNGGIVTPPVVTPPVVKPGSTKDNPYVLDVSKGKAVVPFKPGDADVPQFISLNGKIYTPKAGKDKNQLQCFNGSMPVGKRYLRLNYDPKTLKAGDVPTVAADTATTQTTGGYGGNGGYGSYDYPVPPPPPPEYPVKIGMGSPLVLDMDGDGQLTSAIQSKFDLDGNGTSELISDVDADDAMLVFDNNGNGTVNGSDNESGFGANGGELFGNNTDLNADGKADGFANGFEALKAFANQKLAGSADDGQLDANEIQQLEAAGLRVRIDGDLHKLSDRGISNLNLNFTESDQVDQNGNELRQQSSFTVNGREQGLVDVWFRMNAVTG